jgi:hypothetical protein
MISCVFSRFLAPYCALTQPRCLAEMRPARGPRGAEGRPRKKRTPIDLSVSPAKTKRGSPPKKKLKQQSILPSMRTKSRHDELVQAA